MSVAQVKISVFLINNSLDGKLRRGMGPCMAAWHFAALRAAGNMHAFFAAASDKRLWYGLQKARNKNFVLSIYFPPATPSILNKRFIWSFVSKNFNSYSGKVGILHRFVVQFANWLVALCGQNADAAKLSCAV